MGNDLRNILIEHWKSKNFLNNQIRLAGPYQATIEKINSNFRIQICVNFMRAIHPKNVIPKDIWQQKNFFQFLKIDVDPLSFL
ncbi:MAG: hypothetical protein V4591_12245 [Bdellovibrionota bacterium]